MVLFILCVTVLPTLLGLPFIRLKKEKDANDASEAYMLGLLFLFLLGEASACAVIPLDSGSDDYRRLMGALSGICCLISALLCRKLLLRLPASLKRLAARRPVAKENTFRQRLELIMLLLLFALQLAGYFLYVPDVGGDTTVETVLATTTTETVFQYNPVTGLPLVYGMYPIYKLASLPLLYSALQRLCGLPVQTLMYYALPLWLLCVHFMLLGAWGRELFGKQTEKRRLFLIFAGLMLVVGDGKQGTFAYGLLHGGFKGPVLAAALIVSFGFYMLCRLILKREWLYGMAGMALAVCGFLFTVPLFLPDGLAVGVGDMDRQWGMLLLSIVVLYIIREKIKRKWKVQEILFLAVCLLAGMLADSALTLLGTAYTGVCIWGVAEEWKKGNAMLAGLLILICMAGTVLPFQSEALKKWHISQGDKEIQDKIAALAENYEGSVTLLAPDAVMETAKLGSGKIVLPYGKDLWYENCNREIAEVYTAEELTLFEQRKIDYKQPDTIAAMAAEMRCDVLVLRERMSEEAALLYGWREMSGATGYALYCK